MVDKDPNIVPHIKKKTSPSSVKTSPSWKTSTPNATPPRTGRAKHVLTTEELQLIKTKEAVQAQRERVLINAKNAKKWCHVENVFVPKKSVRMTVTKEFKFETERRAESRKAFRQRRLEQEAQNQSP